MSNLPVVHCDYCRQSAVLVKGSEIYGAAHQHKWFWKCNPCKAWVRANEEANFKPMGRFANKELREARAHTHKICDSLIVCLMRRSGITKEHARERVKIKLAERLMIPRWDCSINFFDVSLCEQAADICQQLFKAEGCE